jgi:hypothetical protein
LLCLYSAMERDVIARTIAIPIAAPKKHRTAIEADHTGHPGPPEGWSALHDRSVTSQPSHAPTNPSASDEPAIQGLSRRFTSWCGQCQLPDGSRLEEAQTGLLSESPAR